MEDFAPENYHFSALTISHNTCFSVGNVSIMLFSLLSNTVSLKLSFVSPDISEIRQHIMVDIVKNASAEGILFGCNCLHPFIGSSNILLLQ